MSIRYAPGFIVVVVPCEHGRLEPHGKCGGGEHTPIWAGVTE